MISTGSGVNQAPQYEPVVPPTAYELGWYAGYNRAARVVPFELDAPRVPGATLQVFTVAGLHWLKGYDDARNGVIDARFFLGPYFKG